MAETRVENRPAGKKSRKKRSAGTMATTTACTYLEGPCLQAYLCLVDGEGLPLGRPAGMKTKGKGNGETQIDGWMDVQCCSAAVQVSSLH